MESEILNGEFGSDAFNFSSFWRPHWFPLLPSLSPAPTRPGFPTAYFPVLSPDLFRGVLKGFPEPSQGLPEATFEPIGSVENWC